MTQILGENIVFHTTLQISNKNKSSKIYDNVLVIKDDNFNNFLKEIKGEEEIEEIKFKLKKNPGKNGKMY
jgi:hypothetical protein